MKTLQTPPAKSNTDKANGARSQNSLAALSGAAAAFLLADQAAAQGQQTALFLDPGALSNANLLDKVNNLTMLADGRLQVAMSNGQTVTLAQSAYTVTQSGVVVSSTAASTLTAAAGAGAAAGTAGAGVSLPVVGAGVAAAGGATAAAASGGGDDSGDDAPAPQNTAPVFTSGATASVDENETAAYAAEATDSDGDAITYSLATGGDNDLFDIDAATGAVTFKTAPDFEAPADANSDNVYDITVQASDGTDTTTQTVAITVNDVDETPVNAAPVFSSGASAAIDENATSTVYSAVASDADNDAITYSLAAGGDNDLFDIDATTGNVTFKASPDFETPADADGDNVYNIIVQASDGTNTTTQDVAIAVNDVINENAPVFTSSASADIDENTPIATTAYTAAASDADNDTITFSLATGGDNELFDIDATTGAVTFKQSPNFEAPSDTNGDNIYNLTVQASDGTNTTVQNVAVTVNDVFEAAPIISLTTLNGSEGFIVQGDSGNDNAGRDVSSAGDVNGDGIDDFIIGAPYGAVGAANTGEAYVVFGKTSGFGTDVSGRQVIDLTTLSAAEGFIIEGDSGNDRAGRSVSSAGDINGDGYDDLIIGAPYGRDFSTNSGEAYVVFGKASGFGAEVITDGHARQVIDLTELSAADGFIVQGTSNFHTAGFSVSSAGDVNGDGIDDLIIGAPGGDLGATDAGEAYVVFGRTGGFGTETTTAGHPRQVIDLASLSATDGFIIQGDETSEAAGRNVSSAGDVNGDGIDDLLIGAPGGGDGGNGAGESYVVFGRTGGFGTEVTNAGHPRQVIDIANLSAADGFIVQGDSEDDRAGRISSAGDVNGDGFDDLIIGAASSAGKGTRTGEAYVVFGKDGGFGTADSADRQVIDLTSLSAAEGFIIEGAAAYDSVGYSVSSAGDVNGDGFDDLIIGAAGARNYAGNAYVVFGKAGGFGTAVTTNGHTRQVIDLANLSSSEGFIIHGDAENDSAGFSVSSAGDINSDGFDDLIVGAPGGADADPGAGSSGEAYVIFGGADVGDVQIITNGQTLTGTAGADVLIGRAGDDVINGNGGADVIRAGAGDDVISISDVAFATIDGGTGTDTLRLDGAGLSLDLDDPALRIDSIEAIDLTGTGGNTIGISKAALLNLTEERENGGAPIALRGGAGDTIIFNDDGWTVGTSVTENGVTYDVYTNGDTSLRVEQGVDVDLPLPPVFTSGATAAFDENATGTAYTAAATDANNDAITYSLAAGGDNDLFDIDATTGAVTFKTPPNFEAPADANGDNVYDITVQASDGTGATTQNVAVTVNDIDDTAPIINVAALNASKGFVVQGDANRDELGRSVSSAGDINGDGFDDFIIGAPDGADGGDEAGEAYVLFGKEGGFGTDLSGRQVINLTELNAADGFIIQGDETGDAAGRTVSSAGDINGDGIDDLIIGAPDGDDGAGSGFRSGEAYVVFGKTGGFGTEVIANGHARQVIDLTSLSAADGFIIQGDSAEDNAGLSVSSAGDINGDGIDDVIVGAPSGGDAGSSAGEAYVVFGKDSGFGAEVITGGNARQVIDLASLSAADGFIIQGGQGDNMGSSVSAAGDVNGDGIDDLIVGASYGSARGEAHVVFGRNGGFGTEVTTDGHPRQVIDITGLGASDGFVIQAAENYAYTGQSVSSAGDLNGDGFDDIIVGAPYAAGGRGETYVVFGKDGGFGANQGGRQVVDLASLDASEGVIIRGGSPDIQSGVTLSSAGDVNGDGFDDLIVGAPYGAETGEAYVVFGKADGFGTADAGRQIIDLQNFDLDAGIIIRGESNFDQAGRSVSAAGDVNGDGFDDLIVGAPFGGDGSGSGTGEAYVIYGGADIGAVEISTAGQLINGTAGAEMQIGTAGNDSFNAVGAGDVARGGAGNDVMLVSNPDFVRIDGGTGNDTLAIGGDVDLRTLAAKIDSIETIDLRFSGDVNITLDALTLRNLTEERENGGVSVALRGDAGDTVTFGETGWALGSSVTEGGVTYDVYTNGATSVRIEQGVDVEAPAAPVFTSGGTATVEEGTVGAYYVPSATDANNDPITFSLAAGGDNDRFAILPNGNVIFTGGAADFENPVDANGDNVYEITVQASDGGLTTTQNVVITVTDKDEAPAFTSGAAASVNENNMAAYTAVATDPEGSAVAYSLAAGGDNDLFDIDATTGAVTFKTAPDFETPADADGDNVYDIAVSASDGGLTRTQNVSVTVSNINEAPAFTSAATAATDENTPTTTPVYTATATDEDAGDTVSYSLAAGGDNDLFDIDANTGAVTFKTSPDFENPADIDGGNVYDIVVQASDGVLTTTQNVAITVANVEEAPVFSSAAAVSVDENNMAAYTAAATDPEGNTVTYSLAAGGDNDLFDIDATTGAVTFKTAPDFETPADADGDNVYDIAVSASDGGLATTQNVSVTVNNINDNNPAITSSGATAVDENATGTVYTVTATDADNDTLSYSLAAGGDNDLFNIDANTGVVTFKTPPNFEAPADADGDNIYDITVQASDGTNTQAQNVAVTVNDVFEAAPVIDLTTLSLAQGFIIQSDGANDRAGFSVSSAGDIDGDGYDDIIVGARYGDDGGPNAGEAYVVFGKASGFGTEVVTNGQARQVIDLTSLSAAEGFIIQGDEPDDRAGRSVSSAGDINGDGFADIIVGARYGDDKADRAGEAYVVFGKVGGFGTEVIANGQARQVIDLTSLSAADGFIIQGETAVDLVGSSVSSAGDVNGDGYDDLIVGAYGDDGGGSFSGEAYIVFGKDGGFGIANTANGNPRQVIDLTSLSAAEGFIIQGDNAFDQLGGKPQTVSSAGDINGDGYDDIIVGANYGDDYGFNSGEAYVVFGKAGGFGTANTANGNPRQVIDLTSLSAAEGFIIQGDAENDQAGYSVSNAGDINGDGYDDIIVGAKYGDDGTSNAGEAYVVFGKESGFGTEVVTDGHARQVIDLTSLSAADGFIIQGDLPSNEAGRSVSSAGDVNGDGFDDLIVGAPRNGRAGVTAGEAYVVFGKAGGFGTENTANGNPRQVIDLTDLATGEGFKIRGDDQNDEAGASVSSAGDINNDGFDDLIVGAPKGNDKNNTLDGEAYVIFGAADIGDVPISTAGQNLTGTAGADMLIGAAGNDIINDVGAGDVVRGGASDDIISASDTSFAHIDGGTGNDTLHITGSAINLDIRASQVPSVESIETIFLDGTNGTTLVLDELGVLNITEERENGVAILTVNGGTNDNVVFHGTWLAGGSVVDGSITYNIYNNGNAQVRLEQGVLKLGDPIVLDFDGDGLAFQTGADAVRFDLDADGFAEYTAWPAAGDGVLVMDRDGSGVIENGREVVSEHFAEGGFTDSLDALQSLDENGDGVLDLNDSAFADLKVWNDLNQDGVSQAGELSTLDQLDIRSFDLAAAMIEQSVDGQRIFAESGAQTNDGAGIDVYAVMLASSQTPMGAPIGDSEPSLGTQETGEIYMINQPETQGPVTLDINMTTQEWIAA